MNAINESGLTKKQRRELRKLEKHADVYRSRRRKKARLILVLAVIGLVILGGVYYYVKPADTPDTKDYVKDDTDPFRGSDTALVTIEEYSDFECPACQFAETAFPQVLDAYPTQVKIIFNDYPLSMHANARQAAEAAQCAYAQGKFWDYHDRLFVDQEKWSSQSKADFTTTLKSYAGDLSLDQEKFNRCLDNGEQGSAVSRDLNEGNQRKLKSTPTFFVNGVEQVGGKTFEEWKTIIDEAITKAEAVKAIVPTNDNSNTSSDNSTNTNG